jgi:hypothetical protein
MEFGRERLMGSFTMDFGDARDATHFMYSPFAQLLADRPGIPWNWYGKRHWRKLGVKRCTSTESWSCKSGKQS